MDGTREDMRREPKKHDGKRCRKRSKTRNGTEAHQTAAYLPGLMSVYHQDNGDLAGFGFSGVCAEAKCLCDVATGNARGDSFKYNK